MADGPTLQPKCTDWRWLCCLKMVMKKCNTDQQDLKLNPRGLSAQEHEEDLERVSASLGGCVPSDWTHQLVLGCTAARR